MSDWFFRNALCTLEMFQQISRTLIHQFFNTVAFFILMVSRDVAIFLSFTWIVFHIGQANFTFSGPIFDY